jgi:hypothetical protein
MISPIIGIDELPPAERDDILRSLLLVRLPKDTMCLKLGHDPVYYTSEAGAAPITFVCTRCAGHSGRHIATDHEHVFAIWEDEPDHAESD